MTDSTFVAAMKPVLDAVHATVSSKQPHSTNLDSFAGVTPTSYSLTLLPKSTATEWRTALGLDSAATHPASDFATPSSVATAIAALVNSAPGTLDTLNELAAALGDDPNFATTIAAAISGKQPLNSNLTSLAAIAYAANMLSFLASSDYAAMRSAMGVATAAQGAIADAAAAVNGVLQCNGAGTFSAASVSLTSGVSGVLPVANGGTGTSGTIDSPPSSPSAYNDEFDATSLDAAWTLTTSATGGGSVAADYASAIPGLLSFVLSRGTAAVWSMINRTSIPSGDWTLTVKIIGRYPYNGIYPSINILDSTDQNGLSFAIGYNTVWGYSGPSFAIYSVDSGTWTLRNTLPLIPDSGKNYIHIIKSGNVFTYYHSTDGVLWVKVGSYTKSFTFYKMYLFFYHNGPNNTAFRFGVDFVRWNDSRIAQ